MRRRTVLVTVAATLAVLAGTAVLVAAAFIYGGWYSVAATQQHYQPVFSLLERALRQSVRWHARDIQAPPLDDAMVPGGAACFQRNCVQCHGAPGIAPDDVGKSMEPQPGPLVSVARRWQPHELYWITRNGIRMTGMPAWSHRLSEHELWSVVAFMQRLPELNPRQYRVLTGRVAAGTCGTLSQAQPAQQPGDIERGRHALFHYACRSCHVIPGVSGPTVHVGPSLDGLAARSTIAGILPNTPENLAHWLRATQQLKPMTAMPQLDVSAQDARDMATYLGTLR